MNPLSFPPPTNKKAQAAAWNAAGQAAIELAVFGAILIFILGTIVRSAVGNGYAQNQNFKAMRMAMLASWNGSKAASMSRNSATILFVEDRLAPDFNKYGDLERNPYIAQGSGTFSYELLYPLNAGEVGSNLPIMDVYINGQHFPLTTASYVQNRTIQRPACSAGGPYDTHPLTQQQCLQNQCLRNAREWAGGNVTESQFDSIVPVTTLNSTTGQTMAANASAIFNELYNEGLIANVTGTDFTKGGSGLSGNVTSLAASALPSAFIAWLEDTFPGTGQTQANQIQSILQSTQTQYKLFYSVVANGTSQFIQTPPTCGSHPCKDKELSSDLVLGSSSNSNGDLMFDLQRNNDPATFVPSGMRPYIAWEWSATAGTTAALIGLDSAGNQYPQYDIDGRLKMVTIYGISQNPDGTPNVTYEDFQGGDIDGSWDFNSCGPRPGLQNDSQIFTFTKEGTYLQIKEGKLYNPETGQFVRSVSRHDTADLIQRSIQLSNNTGDFCNGATPQASVNGSSPNPVEVCIPPGVSDNCFSSELNIKSTCYDENDNMIFVRSRLEDRRGRFWMTDTSGQLKVQ